MDKPATLHVDKPWGRGPLRKAEGRAGVLSSGQYDRGVVMGPLRERKARTGTQSSGLRDRGVVGGAARARFRSDEGKV